MNYIQFNKSSKTNSLHFLNTSKPVVVHIVPEFGSYTVDTLFTNGISLENLEYFISKSQNIKLGVKSFNTKRIFIDAHNKLTSQEVLKSYKKINVLQDYPQHFGENLKENKKFAIVDQTILSQATQYISAQSNLKNGAFFLLQQLKKETSFLKTKDNIENIILFILNDTKPNPGLSDILLHFSTIPNNTISSLACFDKFMLVSMSSTFTNPTIFAIAGYKKNSPIPEIYKNNLINIEKIYQAKEKQLAEKEKESNRPIVANKETQTKQNELDDKLNQLNVNKTQLNNILKKYNVRDKLINDSIKNALIDYISTHKNPEKENLEKITLLAINKLLFNKDTIDDQYLNNPSKLFSKLEEVNTFSQEMIYPDTVDNYIIEPKETIGLKKVTSLVRHKYEFSDTIHKNIEELFGELQTRATDPIKILKITHNYEDNNLNRFINYEITLKNLTGKNKTPYKVNVKIPGLVNDRYFKLNGKTYILSNQQFFMPITKTEPDECRLINSYQTLTLSLANLKINISEISKLIQYIQVRYPDKVLKVDIDANKNILKATLVNQFNQHVNIDLTSNVAYECPYNNIQLKLDEDTNKWYEYSNNEPLHGPIGKSEYLYDRLEEILKDANPLETLTKSKKSIPYIVIYGMAMKLPLIIYMWQQLGLIQSLHRLGIEYKSNTEPDPNAHFHLELKDKTYLDIYCKSRREKLIVNGLYDINFKKYSFENFESLNYRNSIDEYLLDKDSRALVNLDLLTENAIDINTKQILENDGNSTNLIDILSNDMVDKLLNDQPNALSDLKIYRNRQSEVIFTLLYRMLMMAHRNYSSNIKFDDNAKLFISENYVTDCLLGINPHMKGNAALELVNPYSPVTELKSASKCIKTGPRGLPSKRMIKVAHRNIHPSQYGNQGGNATTEYADVGIVNHLTMTTLMTNKFGSYGIKDTRNINGWELVTLDESLIPFVNEMQADRVVLGYTHKAQCIPIKDGEVPILATGAEFVVPQLASNRFVNIAKGDGEILDVKKDEYIKVQYTNGVTEYIDISPRLANTKRSSFISLDMNTKPIGYKFKEKELLSWTNSFNGDAYSAGRNLVMALMNYDSSGHEDGYCITEPVCDKFISQHLREVNAIVPLNSKIFKFIDEHRETAPGEVLLEFGYVNGDLDTYVTQYELIDDESEESDAAVYNYLGNNIQITSPGGYISEIRIYVNNKNQLDPSVIQVWKRICQNLKTKAKLYSYGKVTERDKIAAIDNLDMSQLKTGNHKVKGKLFEGARIVFYIKTDRKLGLGDKICNRFGGKGVVSRIVPTDEIPRAQYSGNIDIFLSPFGMAGRKNLVIMKELYITKILVTLAKRVRESIDSKTPEKLKDFILQIYDLLDNSKDKKYYKLVDKKLSDLIKKKTFTKEIASEHLKFMLISEPFNNTIPLENLNKASDILRVPLDEIIYLPKYNTWTKTAVPVGFKN